MSTTTRADELLLATKFFIPVASQPLVARTKLTNLLNESLQRRLTVVCAPAGFGKSTLLAEWVRSLPAPTDGPFVAWLSLDEDDDNPARFGEYFITALSRAFPSVGSQAMEYLHTPEGPAMHNVQTVLINSLVQSEAEHLVILDDYHYVTDPAIHSGLAFLLDHLPPNAHIIVSSRVDPPLQLSRLRARGWLLEVRTDDLRVTLEEGTDFLQVTTGVDLPAHESLQVIELTEGWFVGLQLLGHSLRGETNPGRILAAMNGEHEYILDYLTEEVLRGQPKEVRDFLLQTSILNELSASLCDAVMGYELYDAQSETWHGSQSMLRYLERANLFLVPLDHQQRWYRYHHLFAEALRYQLERRYEFLFPDTEPGGKDVTGVTRGIPPVALLHRRASDWYREHGHNAEATAHALQAQEWNVAVELIQAQLTGMTIRMPADMPTLLRWFRRLPEAVLRTQPSLCIAYVNALFWTGRTAEAALWLDVLEESLQNFSTSDTPVEPERERMMGDAIAKRAFLVAAHEEDGERALALCDEACSHLTSEDHNELSIISWVRQLAYVSLGRAVEATESALERIDHSRQAGLMYLHIPALADAGALLQLQGKLYAAEQMFAQAIDVGNPRDRLFHSSAALAYLYQADLLREWNRLDDALASAQKGLEIAGDEWSPMLRLGGVNQVLARLHLARGELDEASAALDGILPGHESAALTTAVRADGTMEAINTIRFRYMHPWCADAERVRLWLAREEQDRAARWASRTENQRRSDTITHGQPYPAQYRQDCEDIAFARIALAHSSPDEALKTLEPLAQHAQEGGRLSHLIQIKLLQALAYDLRGRQGDDQISLTILAEAVQMGETEGFIRSFVDEGPSVANLLSRLRARGTRVRSPVIDAVTLSYLNRLLAAFESTVTGTIVAPIPLPTGTRVQGADTPIKYGEFLVEPLSQRELEVLQLLAQGASNAEIAEHLFIALNTTKRHISNIFEKLGVSNRTQAVARARSLGLIIELG